MRLIRNSKIFQNCPPLPTILQKLKMHETQRTRNPYQKIFWDCNYKHGHTIMMAYNNATRVGFYTATLHVVK